MADQQRGSAAKVVIDTETTFNETPAKHFPVVLYMSSESLRMNRNLISSKTIRSSRQPIKPVRGNEEVAGDINFELNPQCGRLLKHAFGTYSAPWLAGGVYYHQFKIGDLPSMCIEKGFKDLTTDKFFQYTGCKVGSFKVAARTEGFLDSTISLMGATEVVADAAVLDASPSDLGCTPFDGFGGSVFINGTAVAEVTEVDFTLENGLDGNTYVMNGTGHRFSLPEGTAKVTGTLRALFTDAAYAYYKAAVDHTEKALRLEFVSGTGAGTLGNEKLTFYMDEILFKPQAPVIQGPTGLLVELPFEAFYENYDDSDDNAFMALLMCPTSNFNV
jgi:hypothetical protein